ncbi:MAG: NAD-binding protein [Anaerolineales bacterium]|nr:NAD-binding protein [Anaerolineales bacterium]
MSRAKGFFHSRPWRRVKRDTAVFAHHFPWLTALGLLLTILGTAYLFQVSYNQVKPGGEGYEYLTYIKAVYAVLNMTFFQLTYADMPPGGELDIFAVVVPPVGLALFTFLGLKVIRFIRIAFVRTERGQDWQEAVVESTVKDHIIICGLGRVGYRVARELLLGYDQALVGIEETPSPLVAELLAQDLPVIMGDAESEEVLKKAGIERAKTVVVCTNKEFVNLGIAFRVRELNQRARIILRLFEDELVEDIKTSFKVDVIISRSAVAALSFTYAAIGSEIIETFALGERTYVLARVSIGFHSPLLDCTIAEVAEAQDVTVVCYNCGRTLTIEPDPATVLQAGDNLFIFTTIDRLMPFVEYGLSPSNPLPPIESPILVCGLGHTGYRVVTNLLDLGRRVTALDFEPSRLTGRLAELNVPLKYGDLRWKSTLLEAGIEQAAAIVVCTEDDMLNLQIALAARALKPVLRVITRIFDDRLGEQLRQTFQIDAVFSTSALATPDFVSAALNRMNVRTVAIAGIEQVIVRLQVAFSVLYDLPLADLQAEEDLTILLHARGAQVNIPPVQTTRLRVGDEIVVLVAPHKLDELNRRNKTRHELKAEGYQ